MFARANSFLHPHLRRSNTPSCSHHRSKYPHKMGDSVTSPPASDSSGSLKSSRSSKTARRSSESCIVSLIRSISSKMLAKTADGSIDSSTDKTPMHPFRSSTELAIVLEGKIEDLRETGAGLHLSEDSTKVPVKEISPLAGSAANADFKEEEWLEVKAHNRHIIATVSDYGEISDTDEFRGVCTEPQASLIEHVDEKTSGVGKSGYSGIPWTGLGDDDIAGRKRPELRDPIIKTATDGPKSRSHRPRPEPRPNFHLNAEAPAPKALRPKIPFGKKLSTFFWGSINPDDDYYIPFPPSQTPSSRKTPTQRGQCGSGSTERSTKTKSCTRPYRGGIQAHPKSMRTVYIPKYTAEGHLLSTSGKRPRRKGRGPSAMTSSAKKKTKPWQKRSMSPSADHRNFGPGTSSLARDVGVIWSGVPRPSSPVLEPHRSPLQTPSRRRLNPKLHLAHSEAVDDNWIKAYPPNHVHPLDQPSSKTTHRSSQKLTAPSWSNSECGGNVAPRVIFSNTLPLINQAIEEEKTLEEAEQAYQERHRATKRALRRKAKEMKMQEAKQQDTAMLLESMIRSNYKGEYLLEKVSFGLYKSGVRKPMQ
ncbi:hypothetical protein K458DRAFT_57922 [Lentithecium fluviatile CBS 122367]|uniref:Uncharacterized protein n=1 Tax=Lentithecium fluviatile CBS 122367 TaxID=1168545 RepID=A0A6G1IW96_9PLEO|nr:hypothetical protein K458DRAFT_57922 [Lentithecium fluviatile CBS 122367]